MNTTVQDQETKAAGVDPTYEPMTSLLFRTALATQPRGTFVLDIGAGIGHYTSIAVEHGLNVFAFEPRSDLKLERGSSNVSFVQAAVSNVNGKAPLYYTPFRKYSASLVARATGRHTDIMTVETLTLDTSLWGLKGVAVMKLDIEGAEPMALEGAQSLLHGNRPVIFVEVLTDSIGREIERWIPKGYKFHRIDDYAMQVQPSLHLEVGKDWNNFMLIPEGGR